jgi:hypothetical protein
MVFHDGHNISQEQRQVLSGEWQEEVSGTQGRPQFSRANPRYTLQSETGSRSASPLRINPGDDLLSHKVTLAVPWALEGLTSVFGMGTGVAISSVNSRNRNIRQRANSVVESSACGVVRVLGGIYTFLKPRPGRQM